PPQRARLRDPGRDRRRRAGPGAGRQLPQAARGDRRRGRPPGPAHGAEERSPRLWARTRQAAATAPAPLTAAASGGPGLLAGFPADASLSFPERCDHLQGQLQWLVAAALMRVAAGKLEVRRNPDALQRAAAG